MKAVDPGIDGGFEFLESIAKKILETHAPPDFVRDQIPIPHRVIGGAGDQLEALAGFMGDLERGVSFAKGTAQDDEKKPGRRGHKKQRLDRLQPRPFLEIPDGTVGNHDPENSKKGIEKNRNYFGTVNPQNAGFGVMPKIACELQIGIAG